MTMLFLHGWQSTPGGLKPTYLKGHGHEVLNPALPDDDFDKAVLIAQADFDGYHPDVVVGSSRGGAVAMNIDTGDTPLVLLCPAWKRWGTATTVKPGTIILHSRADETVPFADSQELLRNSGEPESLLIAVGTDHRLADPKALEAMLEAVETTTKRMVADSQSQTQLRESFLDEIMKSDGIGFSRAGLQAALMSVDDLCDSRRQKWDESSYQQFPLSLPEIAGIVAEHIQSDFNYKPTSDALVFEPPHPVALIVLYALKRIGVDIGRETAFCDTTPRITVKTLIIPCGKTKEGTLVKGVSALWFKIIQRIKNDPDSLHEIDCWTWEEILAGAYKRDGWDVVILTPRRGDHGIDVIAERKGWGQLRFLLLDQMKAYKPGHVIGPDEIREMKGVLLEHPEASKGLVTTTATFTAGALEAAASLFPRLELRPREKLVEWLASVAIEGPEMA